MKDKIEKKAKRIVVYTEKDIGNVYIIKAHSKQHKIFDGELHCDRSFICESAVRKVLGNWPEKLTITIKKGTELRVVYTGYNTGVKTFGYLGGKQTMYTIAQNCISALTDVQEKREDYIDVWFNGVKVTQHMLNKPS